MKTRLMKYPPLASLRGYDWHNFPQDAMAALVVAALSIPISMGYAQIAGLPPVYGLYASILPVAVYAITTGTRLVVFGMDSAAVAVTGSVLVSMGIAGGSQQAIDIMPQLTVITAAFLLLFALVRAGKLIRYVPAPVMYGFVAGISIVIVINQIPLLCGVPSPHGHNAFENVGAIVASFSQANVPTIVIGAACIVGLVLLQRFAPKVPAALVVLAAATVVTAALKLDGAGVAVLGSVPSQLPSLRLPSFAGADWPRLISGAFSIAVTVAIESLLTLNVFSLSAGLRPHGNRELVSFGIADIASGLIGCPPCSASLSRTAAGRSAGATSQMTGLLSAVVIALFIVVLSPYLYYLPQPALGAVVVMAMAGVVNYKKIRRYAKNIRLELATLIVVALTVMLAGAIAGIAVGIVLSLVETAYRARQKRHRKLMGFERPEDAGTMSAAGRQSAVASPSASSARVSVGGSAPTADSAVPDRAGGEEPAVTGVAAEKDASADSAVDSEGSVRRGSSSEGKASSAPSAEGVANADAAGSASAAEGSQQTDAVPAAKRVEPSIDLKDIVISYPHGFLSFTNIDKGIEQLEARIKPNTKVVILEISGVTGIDATATESLRRLRRSLHGRGIDVRVVRGIAPSTDHYTRYELRRVMKKTKTYPTVRAALEDVNRMKRKQLTEIPLSKDDSGE